MKKYSNKMSSEIKVKIIFFLLIISNVTNYQAQTIANTASRSNNSNTFNVEQVSLTQWNSDKGIMYVQGPGANLGATSFQVLDNNQAAFLCNSSQEIVIIDLKSGDAIKRFPIILFSRDFAYENETFYVLGEDRLVIYDKDGKEKNQIKFSNKDIYLGIERITRFANSTYLLLPSGDGIKVESNGEKIEPQENSGLLSSLGNSVEANIIDENTYNIKVTLSNGKVLHKKYITDNKVGGIYVIGSTNNRVFVELQTYISENYGDVERRIVSVEIKENELGEIVGKIKPPHCYYVQSNKELYISPDGNIFNMITSPQGVYIFKLTETKAESSKGYPKSLTSLNYHYNYHLMKVDGK